MSDPADLTPELLLYTYSQGIFPMGHDDGEIYWYDPDPRAIIPLDERFHVPRSLARRIRQGGFEVRVDSAFRAVITAEGAAQLAATRTAPAERYFGERREDAPRLAGRSTP